MKVQTKEGFLKNAVLIEEIRERSYISNTLEFFESYHCPGAYGIKYKYYNECFIYPGDICLRNGFYDFSDDFNEIIKSEKKVTILADCALVPRGDSANTDKNFEDIVDNIMTSSSNKVFVSKGSELLFNIYICLFRMAIDGHKDWIFIVSEELFYLLRNVLRTWLLPKYKGDLFIEHVIERTGINYAETQRLYTISNLTQFADYKEKRLMFILLSDDLPKLSNNINIHDIDAYLVGPLASNKNITDMLGSYGFEKIFMLSSPDWSFHSEKNVIKEFLNEMIVRERRVILFHAYPKIIRKFIKEFPEEVQNYLDVISNDELQL